MTQIALHKSNLMFASQNYDKLKSRDGQDRSTARINILEGSRDRQCGTHLGLIYDPFLRNNLNETQVNTKNGRRTTVNKEIQRGTQHEFN